MPESLIGLWFGGGATCMLMCVLRMLDKTTHVCLQSFFLMTHQRCEPSALQLASTAAAL